MAALNLKKARSSLHYFADADYTDKLSAEELAWLSEFNAAYYNVAGPMVEEVGNVTSYTTNGRNEGKASETVSGRKALNKMNYARRSDVMFVAYRRVRAFEKDE